VTEIVVLEGGPSRDELLSLAASAESASEHPLAQAVVREARRCGMEPQRPETFRSHPGMGIDATVNARKVLAGTIRFLRENEVPSGVLANLAEKLALRGRSPILLAVDGAPAGVLGVSDPVREGSAEAVRRLHRLGLRVIMLTGDRERTARAVAREVGIDEVVADVLPGNKADVVRDLRDRGRIVAMVGDGINDAPALAVADLGIAIGTGTDIAIAASDITLVRPDLAGVVSAIRLSRRTLRVIRQNLFWAFAYNSLGIPVAAGLLYPWTGWLLSPVLASAAMSLSSVSVVGNSLRLRRLRL
jgi:Cu+-exporting ATPase